MGTAYFHRAFGNEVGHIIHTVLSIQKVNYVQHNGDSTFLCAGFKAIRVAVVCLNLCSRKNLRIVLAKCNSAQAQRNSCLRV